MNDPRVNPRVVTARVGFNVQVLCEMQDPSGDNLWYGAPRVIEMGFGARESRRHEECTASKGSTRCAAQNRETNTDHCGVAAIRDSISSRNDGS